MAHGKTDRKASRKNPGGRPTVMTPQVRKRICQYVSQGLPREHAANLAGVSVDAFYSCQARFPEFAEAIKDASARFVRTHVQRIAKAGRKEWTASAWLLERLFPESFGKLERHVLRAVTAPEPEELGERYIAAVSRALGFGQFVPRDTRLLPKGNESDDDILDILPE